MIQPYLEPVVVVVASDNGSPRLSSSTTVRITVQDVNDNEPVFEKTFYNVSLKENESDNLCFLKVVATDPDCGINSQVGTEQNCSVRLWGQVLGAKTLQSTSLD
jgi:hypothetical protein